MQERTADVEPPADAEQERQIALWLGQNEPALAIFEDALKRDKAAAPDTTLGEGDYDGFSKRRNLFRLVRQHSLRLSSQGKPAEALAVSRSMLKAGRLLKGAGGGWIDYLVASLRKRGGEIDV